MGIELTVDRENEVQFLLGPSKMVCQLLYSCQLLLKIEVSIHHPTPVTQKLNEVAVDLDDVLSVSRMSQVQLHKSHFLIYAQLLLAATCYHDGSSMHILHHQSQKCVPL